MIDRWPWTDDLGQMILVRWPWTDDLGQSSVWNLSPCNFHIRALKHVRPTLLRNTAATLACHIRALRHARPTLSRNTTATLACSIVQSWSDYCNSVFYGMSESNVENLQTIQNKLARVVCGDCRLRSSKEMLMTLHCLQVRSCIKYKLAVLTYKALNIGQPVYLRDELSIYEPVGALRSSGTFQLQVPPTSTNIGRRAFRYSAPEIWNTLSYELWSASCIGTFRRSLKTHFFQTLGLPWRFN